jgi:aspartyl-tRNA(Asn)/glutamyl-tRNA(Gln) amidotransferase subunit B
LEEDAGKNIHSGKTSFIDLNRAGTPLLEVVTDPEIRSATEASEFLRKLRTLVCFLKVSDGNLEEGSFRCDANVSVRKKGDQKLGTRCEVKNLNSFKNVERAIYYEGIRQIDLVESGQKIKQETRSFDAASGKTKSLRSKEKAQDYRYFPEPDLPRLTVEKDFVETMRRELPELPEQKKQRYIQDFDISSEDARIIIDDYDLAIFFEHTLKLTDTKVPPKIVANWLISEYMREVSERGWSLRNPPLSSEFLAKLLLRVTDGTISGKIAKSIFREICEYPRDPDLVIKEKGLNQISDESQICKTVKEVVESSPSQVQDFISGKKKVLAYFVGEVMKRSKGKMNPELVNKALLDLLSQLERKV